MGMQRVLSVPVKQQGWHKKSKNALFSLQCYFHFSIFLLTWTRHMLAGKCDSLTGNIFVSFFVLIYFFQAKYCFLTADVTDFNEKV